MTIFDSQAGRGRVVGAGVPRSVLISIAIGIIGLLSLVLLFNCVTRVALEELEFSPYSDA